MCDCAAEWYIEIDENEEKKTAIVKYCLASPEHGKVCIHAEGEVPLEDLHPIGFFGVSSLLLGAVSFPPCSVCVNLSFLGLINK